MERIEAVDYESYKHFMDEVAAPYIKERSKEGYLEVLPGQKLYHVRYLADEAKGVIVLLHGFTEHIDKYREVVYQFLKGGYHVWMLQQREHGKSYRSTDDMNRINILDYRRMIEDVHTFVHDVVFKDHLTSRIQYPVYLCGHSMGGGVAACYSEAYPGDFKKVVLCSPMLQLTSPIPVPLSKAYADLMILCGRGTDPLPGSMPFDAVEDFEHSNANSPARYRYWFEQVKADAEKQTQVCTLNTAREFLRICLSAAKPANVKRIRAQVLLLQAREDAMVGLKGQDEFIGRLGDNGRIVPFEGGRHELYLGTDEMQQKFYSEIFAFLA